MMLSLECPERQGSTKLSAAQGVSMGGNASVIVAEYMSLLEILRMNTLESPRQLCLGD